MGCLRGSENLSLVGSLILCPAGFALSISSGILLGGILVGTVVQSWNAAAISLTAIGGAFFAPSASGTVFAVYLLASVGMFELKDKLTNSKFVSLFQQNANNNKAL